MAAGRRGAIVLVALAMAVGVLLMTMQIVTPGPPPPRPARVPLGPALTSHVALIVLDGVRYSVATDAAYMPRLAERFASRASAELWAEPISMTASAALVFGTGAHAEIDLAIRNEASQPTALEDVFSVARAAGRRTATVGDPVWKKMYPGRWDVTVDEAHQVAVGLSDDQATFRAAGVVQATTPPVNLAVYHFPHPDHMAHGHGIQSLVYRSYIRSFDALLDAFLGRFAPDTTLIVLGDHGATLAGIHGSDTEEQRRTFLVASGPGVVAGAHHFPRADGVDIAPTLALLLGIAAPRHARGHPLLAWLDLPEATRAGVACASLHDLGRLLGAAYQEPVAPVCDPGAPAAERVASSLPIARALDTRISAAANLVEARGVRASWCAAALSAVLGLLLFHGRAPLRTLVLLALLFGLVMVLAVLVTAHLEKLPGAWLTPARGVLYVGGNMPLLLWLARPRRVAGWLERLGPFALLLVPGLLVVTETDSALVEAYLLAAVLGAFALVRGIPGSHGFPRPWAGLRSAWPLLWLAPLAVVCVDSGNFVPGWLQETPRFQLALGCSTILLFGLSRGLSAPLLATTALALASLVLRRHAPLALCVGGWALLAAAAGIAIVRRQRALAEMMALGSYAWVSRDLELPLLVSSYLAACAVGRAVRNDPPSPLLGACLVSFAFAWGYVQQVAVQMGLNFMHLDFAAGTFRDPGTPMARIAAALIYKYAMARGYLLAGLLIPLPDVSRYVVLRGLVALYALRVVVLVASLESARHSFWTPIWVTSELPHVLLALLLSSVAHSLVGSRSERAPA